jgi:hypothetical protein
VAVRAELPIAAVLTGPREHEFRKGHRPGHPGNSGPDQNTIAHFKVQGLQRVTQAHIHVSEHARRHRLTGSLVASGGAAGRGHPGEFNKR